MRVMEVDSTILHSSAELKNDSCDETEADSTIHGFNISGSDNITVVELDKRHCEGSDSGVEVIESADNCAPHEFDNNCAQSCDSSIISCCSNYDEAYNLLVRKNSTLLEDYTLRNGDVTSENGSESSSISGKTSHTRRSLVNSTKKKVSVTEAKTKSAIAKERSRSKPPVNPVRLKSIDRLQGRAASSLSKSPSVRSKPVPNNLELNKTEPKRVPTVKTSGARTPTATPTDDGRWPSINSKPAPLMSRSMKNTLMDTTKSKLNPVETKTLDKYGTLPRRRKEKSEENIKKKPSASRESSTNRLGLKNSLKQAAPLKMTTSLYKSKQKVKIYHEISIQTALTMTDVEKAFAGESVVQKDPRETEKCDRDTQVNMRAKDLEKLEEQLRQLSEKYADLAEKHKSQKEQLRETEEKLQGETLEKESLLKELQNNSQRILAILGNGSEPQEEDNGGGDSLLVLENRFQNVGQVVIKQEEEISSLNNFCRSLHRELKLSLSAHKQTIAQHKEQEHESLELHDFLTAEKSTLAEALKEAETEVQKSNSIILQKDRELKEKLDECKHLVRLSEQRKQENLALQTRLGALELKSKDLLVHQGSSVSGAAVALGALIRRLEGLVDELIHAYTISDQELEDMIYHNEAYNNSSSSPESTQSTPEKIRKFPNKSPSPKNKGSSFVSAVINAIKNAAGQTPFTHNNKELSRDLCTELSSSNEMLDSETEPCLMMEHVLEDVVVPDGHSHNMISSGHLRLTQSESLKDLSQAILNRQISEQASLSYTGSLTNSFNADLTELFPALNLVDQVIGVDNLVTRLLKVIRIIQMENEDYMSELQEQRDTYSDQVDNQKETNIIVVTQLKDWEVLGARLKTEVKELMAQLSRKNGEMDNIKSELNNQREQVEKLNQDVCELSTALAKAELEMKMREEEVTEEMRKWEKTGELPTAEILSRLMVAQNDIPVLKEKLADKERFLNGLTQEFLVSRQILNDNLKEAVKEARKQYEAIDNALEVFHSIQSVVQQCAPLSKLQRELEETNFHSASIMPLVAPSDCNANAGLLQQAVANLEIASPINTTA